MCISKAKLPDFYYRLLEIMNHKQDFGESTVEFQLRISEYSSKLFSYTNLVISTQMSHSKVQLYCLMHTPLSISVLFKVLILVPLQYSESTCPPIQLRRRHEICLDYRINYKYNIYIYTRFL